MPYVQRISKAGNTIEIEKYFTSRYNKKGVIRKTNKKPTKEVQKKINDKAAERKLRLLINNNFGYGDYHIVLTYRQEKGSELKSREEMKVDNNKFIRKLRTLYRRNNQELKYIHVMEIGSKSARHHHLVINGGVDIMKINDLWKDNGYIEYIPLDDSGQYKKLAQYLIKYTSATMGTDNQIQGKRYNPSRNLVQPNVEVEIIVKREIFKNKAVERKGYYVDKETVLSGQYAMEYGGYEFIRYTLVKLKGNRQRNYDKRSEVKRQ